jgi:hypothetical protein
MEQQKNFLDAGFIEQKGAQYWNPEKEGEMIKGKIVAVNDGDFGRQYTIEQASGEMIITPSHAALQSRLRQAALGNYVQLVYLGEDTANKKKGQNALRLYQVGLKR